MIGGPEDVRVGGRARRRGGVVFGESRLFAICDLRVFITVKILGPVQEGAGHA